MTFSSLGRQEHWVNLDRGFQSNYSFTFSKRNNGYPDN